MADYHVAGAGDAGSRPHSPDVVMTKAAPDGLAESHKLRSGARKRGTKATAWSKRSLAHSNTRSLGRAGRERQQSSLVFTKSLMKETAVPPPPLHPLPSQLQQPTTLSSPGETIKTGSGVCPHQSCFKDCWVRNVASLSLLFFIDIEIPYRISLNKATECTQGETVLWTAACPF